MREAIVRFFSNFTRKERATAYKAGATSVGVFLFIFLFPVLLVWLSRLAEARWPKGIETTVAGLAVTAGAFFLGWAVTALWIKGHGTPNYVAPTTTLVTTGPYRLCRNPIMLGASLFYLGLGTLIGDGLSTGVFLFLAALAFGAFYHRFIEEKELLARFGDEYAEYRAKTPFLVPRIW
jgi:protein-S-isoprenylcysteine O-methyltransferase Ste14